MTIAALSDRIASVNDILCALSVLVARGCAWHSVWSNADAENCTITREQGQQLMDKFGGDRVRLNLEAKKLKK